MKYILNLFLFMTPYGIGRNGKVPLDRTFNSKWETGWIASDQNSHEQHIEHFNVCIEARVPCKFNLWFR